MEERFSMLLKAKNITAAKLADEIKAQPSSVSHILSGRNKPGLELIQKILNTYKDISPDWLINGKGPMFRGGVDLFTQGNSVENEKSKIKKSAYPDSGNFSATEEKHRTKKNKKHTKHIDYEMDQAEEFSSIVGEKDLSGEYFSQRKSSNSEKQIERVIIFYTDKSFSEYRSK